MNIKTSRAVWANFLLLVVAIVWGGGFVAGKAALGGLSPVAVLFYRFLLSALAVGVIFWRSIRGFNMRELRYGCLLGVLLFLGLVIQLAALQYTTVAKQSFIAAAYVIFTPLLSWLIFRDRPAAAELTAAFMVLGGVALISLNGDLSIQTGDFMTLGFTLIFALQLIIIARFTGGLSAVNMTFFQIVTACILAAAAVVLLDIPIVITGSVCMLSVGYLAFINTAVAMLLQNYAQKYTKENHAALILALESVFGFIFAVIIFDDPVTPRMLWGCLLIMLGVLLAKLRPAGGK